MPKKAKGISAAAWFAGQSFTSSDRNPNAVVGKPWLEIPPKPATGEGRMQLTEVYRVEADGRWCLRWKTPSMPASSFWYYDTEQEALAAQKRLREG